MALRGLCAGLVGRLSEQAVLRPCGLPNPEVKGFKVYLRFMGFMGLGS